VHVDRLASIVDGGQFYCDAELARRGAAGTNIGMASIKERRLTQLQLPSHPGLYVGHCVPFYFCPRSIMLYVISRRDHPELAYRDGQEPVVHLELDLRRTVAWAEANDRRWAFTLSNAGAYYFEDRANLADLDDINWNAVQTNRWAGQGIDRSVKEGKQAEFLVENSLPWELVDRVAVHSQSYVARAAAAIARGAHRPTLEIKRDWYY
jgi:hypothetical protein